MNEASSKQIQTSSVLRLILQYLNELGLKRSFHCLQEETGVRLNAVSNLESFQNDILKGRWDTVLQSIGTIEITEELLYTLYEHVIHELVEMGEFGAALILLRETSVMQSFKAVQPKEYNFLESLVTKANTKFDKKELYHGMSKEKRRHILANALSEHVQVVMPSRLLSLLGLALRWEQDHNLIPKEQDFDIFRNISLSTDSSDKKFINNVLRKVKMGKKSPPQAATFSSCGKYLITGSSDGLIEAWDWMTGNLSYDLEYQKEDYLMAHESAVLALACSSDSELLASGCKDGDLKVWNFKSGKCQHKFANAHEFGISSIIFHPENTQILTTSFDKSAKLFSLQTYKAIRTFQGHTSYVNTGIFNADCSRVLTGSSDGTIKVWDVKNADCLLSYSPPSNLTQMQCLGINTIIPIPQSLRHLSQDAFFVCTKSNVIQLLTVNGAVLKKLSSGVKESANFVGIALSPDGKWVYAVTETYHLVTFSIARGVEESSRQIHEKDIVGICHHPNQDVLATISFDGNVCILNA